MKLYDVKTIMSEQRLEGKFIFLVSTPFSLVVGSEVREYDSPKLIVKWKVKVKWSEVKWKWSEVKSEKWMSDAFLVLYFSWNLYIL